jgi:RNA polymerase sigma-70 factor (ECF subfamily)
VAFTDAELIARVLESADPNAFAELVRRYQSPVRAFLRRMTRGDEALADDLAQETFLRAWRKLDTCRNPARFSTWLFGIALNQFRARARRVRRLCEEPLDQVGPESESAATPVPPGIRLDLNEALERLTPAERAAILLCCQNGLTHDEAALVLQCPLGTVKTNVLRGKEKLRRWLQL